jgi:transposase
MASVSVERLDHLGVVASVSKDLGLIEMIDARLLVHDQEEITAGEAVAGMILNGLGFSDRPLTLTPQFFANKPLDLLFHEGVRAELFNRFKLGRTLDEAYGYGCALLLSELALSVCRQEGIDARFNHLDTTSFSLTGDDVPDSDEHAMAITHGYAKDHRPDLKQAVLELMVSQDGGVPLMSKSWDGNASDTQIFQERAHALLATFKDAPSPRYLVADAKLYTGRECHQPGQTRLYHAYSGYAQAGLAGDHASAHVGHVAVSRCHDTLSAPLVVPLWHGPEVAGGMVTGISGAG